MEIAIGSEYGNADGSSAMVVLRDDGCELWRRDGIEGDRPWEVAARDRFRCACHDRGATAAD
jgi:hypothetical protein